MSPAHIVIVSGSTDIGSADTMVDHFLSLCITHALGSNEENCALIQNRFVFLDSFEEEFEFGAAT